MKTIFTAFILVAAGLLTGNTSAGQTTIGFGYDVSGNRITRSVVTTLNTAARDVVAVPDSLTLPLEARVGGQPVQLSYQEEEGIVHIGFPVLDGHKIFISVRNPEGRRIFQEPGSARGNQIDLSGKPAGPYQLTIRAGSKEKKWTIVRK